jgi:hypothetical protein
MSDDQNGWVKLSAKTQWDADNLEADPTLELRLELTQYKSRSQMANLLRMLANQVDEGLIHRFDLPNENAAYTAVWDDQTKEVRIYKQDHDEEGGDRP